MTCDVTFDSYNEILRTQAGPMIVNPGIGPVYGATEENAANNTKQLIADVGLDPDSVYMIRIQDGDKDGRMGYKLEFQGRTCSVLMPGLPLENVRYIGAPDQDVRYFPRLYVDGGSWWWMFAENRVKEALILG